MTMACRISVVAVALVGMCSCSGSSRVVTESDGLPSRFEIELRAMYADQRQVYYVLESDGLFNFGGGRDAGIKTAYPDGHITDVQRRELWQIIVDHKLLQAKGSFMAKRERVAYDLRIRTGSQTHHFNTVDDNVPGLEELEAAMFAMHLAMTYDDVMRPIESEMKRRSKP